MAKRRSSFGPGLLLGLGILVLLALAYFKPNPKDMFSGSGSCVGPKVVSAGTGKGSQGTITWDSLTFTVSAECGDVTSGSVSGEFIADSGGSIPLQVFAITKTGDLSYSATVSGMAPPTMLTPGSHSGSMQFWVDTVSGSGKGPLNPGIKYTV